MLYLTIEGCKGTYHTKCRFADKSTSFDDKKQKNVVVN